MARAQLVLETVDEVRVAAAVGQQAWDQEEAQPTRTRRRALGTGQGQDEVGADVGAEPLVAVKTPGRVVASRRRGRGAQVRAAHPLGQEHGAGVPLIVVEARQARHVARDEVGRGVFIEHAGQDVGHGERAADAALGLQEEVHGGELVQLRGGAGQATEAGTVTHRRDPGAVGQPLELVVGGVEGDVVDALAAPVVGFERGRVALGDLVQRCDLLGADAAPLVEIVLGPGQRGRIVPVIVGQGALEVTVRGVVVARRRRVRDWMYCALLMHVALDEGARVGVIGSHGRLSPFGNNRPR